MKTRNRLYIAALLVPAILLAASGASYGAGPGGGPDTPETSPFADNAAVQDNTAAVSPFPLPDTADRSVPVDNAAARDNAASLPPSALPEATEGQAPADASAGEEAEIREPSFGGEPPAPEVSDPIEPVNRGIFYVNDKLYRWMLKPVAKGYKYVVPDDVRIAVRNFFFNLGTPIRAVNALLQGKFEDTGTELARFGINSTIGMAGLFDAAKEFHLTRKDEDTGQTLGVYGLGPGFYMLLPILGPSDARDAVGLVGDTFLDPITYLLSFGWALGVQFVHTETDLTFRINEYEELTEAAVDPYAAVKDFYLQYRAKQIRE
jgi:phospholipid-binding lipoprotein MlaA